MLHGICKCCMGFVNAACEYPMLHGICKCCMGYPNAELDIQNAAWDI